MTLCVPDDLPAAAAAGELHAVLLRCRLTGATERDRFRVALNGAELLGVDPRTGEHAVNAAAGARPAGVARVRREWFALPLGPWLLAALTRIGL